MVPVTNMRYEGLSKNQIVCAAEFPTQCKNICCPRIFLLIILMVNAVTVWMAGTDDDGIC